MWHTFCYWVPLPFKLSFDWKIFYFVFRQIKLQQFLRLKNKFCDIIFPSSRIFALINKPWIMFKTTWRGLWFDLLSLFERSLNFLWQSSLMQVNLSYLRCKQFSFVISCGHHLLIIILRNSSTTPSDTNKKKIRYLALIEVN